MMWERPQRDSCQQHENKETNSENCFVWCQGDVCFKCLQFFSTLHMLMTDCESMNTDAWIRDTVTFGEWVNFTRAKFAINNEDGWDSNCIPIIYKLIGNG